MIITYILGKTSHDCSQTLMPPSGAQCVIIEGIKLVRNAEVVACYKFLAVRRGEQDHVDNQ